ncbi:hypothetical protein ElyMa_005546600 [Elysia marginata]|uniref:Uncharacterized protein n=1 Tax=Elysia marginata TaxID=1093978 RepID=A0AAV4F0N1_9GAST|nr:hypothetical protein ElyMa_005546600 [Elysia marginata]
MKELRWGGPQFADQIMGTGQAYCLTTVMLDSYTQTHTYHGRAEELSIAPYVYNIAPPWSVAPCVCNCPGNDAIKRKMIVMTLP